MAYSFWEQPKPRRTKARFAWLTALFSPLAQAIRRHGVSQHPATVGARYQNESI